MLVGDSGVGKTAIMNMFCDGKYSDRTTTTVGIEYKDKTIKINNKKCLIQLWDTAGQERFRTITPSFYRSAMAILLVYSV
jgi:small GTP-binding protein